MLPRSCETPSWGGRRHGWSPQLESAESSWLNASDRGDIRSIRYDSLGAIVGGGQTPWFPVLALALPPVAPPLSLGLDLPGYDGRLTLTCMTDDTPELDLSAGGLEIFWPRSETLPGLHVSWTLDDAGKASLALPPARSLARRGRPPRVVVADGSVAVQKGGELRVQAAGGPGWAPGQGDRTVPWHRHVIVSGDCGRNDIGCGSPGATAGTAGHAAALRAGNSVSA